MLELLFRSLLLSLRYQQGLQSKLTQFQHRLKELAAKEKQGVGAQARQLGELEQKAASTRKKLSELSLSQFAGDCVLFI